MTGGIEVEGLAKRFGSRLAVEGLTFDVRPGEVFGILGPNGAGKTTAVRMLAGLLSPSEGEATVCGLSVRRQSDALREVVGLLTEQPGLYDRLTGRENLLFYVKLNRLDPARAWPRALGYLKRFGLAGREDEACGTYSKGMKQKLAIVRALVHDPRVIFLDEPTSGLDPESARAVRDAVAELAGEGRTLVLCSHNLPEVERLCSRVAVVKGRMRAVSSVRELRQAGAAVEVRLGEPAAHFVPIVSGLSFGPRCLTEGNLLKVLVSDDEQIPPVISALVVAGARVYSAVRTERPLEEVYLELMREEAA
jgi:ABC-2 type transport system ATP-binding protein